MAVPSGGGPLKMSSDSSEHRSMLNEPRRAGVLSSREISESPVPVADGYAAGLYRQGLDDHGTQRIKIDLLPVPRDATSRDVVGNLASLVTVEEQYEIALWSYEDEEDRCILLTVQPHS